MNILEFPSDIYKLVYGLLNVMDKVQLSKINESYYEMFNVYDNALEIDYKVNERIKNGEIIKNTLNGNHKFEIKFVWKDGDYFNTFECTHNDSMKFTMEISKVLLDNVNNKEIKISECVLSHSKTLKHLSNNVQFLPFIPYYIYEGPLQKFIIEDECVKKYMIENNFMENNSKILVTDLYSHRFGLLFQKLSAECNIMIIFQVLYALAIIQQKYPNYKHNNLRCHTIFYNPNDQVNITDMIHFELNNYDFYLKNFCQINIHSFLFASIDQDWTTYKEWQNNIGINNKPNKYYDVCTFLYTIKIELEKCKSMESFLYTSSDEENCHIYKSKEIQDKNIINDCKSGIENKLSFFYSSDEEIEIFKSKDKTIVNDSKLEIDNELLSDDLIFSSSDEEFEINKNKDVCISNDTKLETKIQNEPIVEDEKINHEDIYKYKYDFNNKKCENCDLIKNNLEENVKSTQMKSKGMQDNKSVIGAQNIQCMIKTCDNFEESVKCALDGSEELTEERTEANSNAIEIEKFYNIFMEFYKRNVPGTIKFNHKGRPKKVDNINMAPLDILINDPLFEKYRRVKNTGA